MGNPETLYNWQLDLLFRIDLSALRPINDYGMKAEDFARRHRLQWEAYNMPMEYKYVYSYIRLIDLKTDPSPYLKYVQDLYFWKLNDTFPLEQGLGIITGDKITLFVCDETDIDRPWYKHFHLLKSLLEKKELERNYDHSAWGYAFSDTFTCIQENDELLDKDEIPACWLFNTGELDKRLEQVKLEIADFFPILHYRMKSVIPIDKKDVLDMFFLYNI